LERLVDDASMFPPGNAGVAEAVAAHLAYRQSWFCFLLGPLVVSDQRLAETGRSVRAAGSEDLTVSVVNTSGAGGLLGLASRAVAGVRLVAVESALRDRDDLAGNAARVVSAAAELGEDVQVFVEIPYAPGWERAVDVVEAAGLCGKIRTGAPDTASTSSSDRLARQLSVLIEADLPFTVTAGRGDHGMVNLLWAVHALVDGASPDEAAELLGVVDTERIAAEVAGWDESDATRVRRRLRSVGACGVLDSVHHLVSLGLLTEPS
jgi:hypothetical protein